MLIIVSNFKRKKPKKMENFTEKNLYIYNSVTNDAKDLRIDFFGFF